MCDTVVALRNSTKNGSIIFGKNSDREPDEPHVIIKIPRKSYPAGSKVKCTYIEIDQAENTYECILFKPSWIWGAEMGVNEYGLVIGNEAVFTKEKQGEKALLGMDILRIALERSKTAIDAVKVCIKMIEKYGQGGNCGYKKNLHYHNSFLIADFTSAYILETAGKKWVAKKVEDIASISNSISITDDYHYSSFTHDSDLLKLKKEERFNFKTKFENFLISSIAQGDFRRGKTLSFMEKKKGNLKVEDFMDLLRQHHKLKTLNFFNGSMKNICMHHGSVISSETVGSMIVELKENTIQIWATGSPLPCMSVYKPIWLDESYSLFTEKDEKDAIKYWEKQKENIYKALQDKKNITSYRQNIDAIQKVLIEKVNSVKKIEEKKSIIQDFWI